MYAPVDEHAPSRALPNTRPITNTIRMANPPRGYATARIGAAGAPQRDATPFIPERPYDFFTEVCVASMAPSQKNSSRPSMKVEKCELARLVAHHAIMAAIASCRYGVAAGHVRTR